MRFDVTDIFLVKLINMRFLEVELNLLNILFQSNKIYFMSIFDVLNFEIFVSNLLIWNNFVNHRLNLKLYQQASIIIKKDSI